MKRSRKFDDLQITNAYHRTCSGIQIDMLDIPRIYAEGRRALAAGEDLDTAIRAFVERIRK